MADRGQNRVVVINPATDKSKMIDIPLTSPRGIAVDTDVNGAVFAYVAERTQVLKMPVYKTVFVAAWVADGAPITDQEVRDQIAVANRTLATCGFEVQLRNNTVNHFSAGGLLDLEINDWANTECRDTLPTLVRTGAEVALLDAPARRSSVQTDVNVYFRSFTVAGGGEPRSVAETVTRDCFIAEGMTDEANSGIIFSVKKLRKYPHQTHRTLAHELGHALLDFTVWGDEHTPMVGGSYPPTNVMSIPATAKRRRFEDPDQCLVINQDLTIFRGDP